MLSFFPETILVFCQMALHKKLCEIKISILTTRHVLNLLEPDAFMEAFGQVLTYHKIINVFPRILLHVSSKIEYTCSKARLIRGSPYKHINPEQYVGITFTFDFYLMIKSPMFLCLLYAIIGRVMNNSLHLLHFVVCNSNTSFPRPWINLIFHF